MTNTIASARPQARSRWIPKRWYAHISLWIACFFLGVPLFYTLLVSTQTRQEINRYEFTPGSGLAENWDIVFNQRHLQDYMVNSAIMTAAITIGKTILSLLAGLAFVYFRFPGKWLVFGFVLITLMMPTEVLIIALFRFINKLNWDNTYLALIVPFLASATGSFLFRQHFSNIPAELSEAAQLDGANPLQFLFRVLVPMSWNTIGALAVVQCLYAWNMYLWPNMIITDPNLDVVQVGIGTLRAGEGGGIQYGPLMLGAVVASLPPLLVFILLQKQFMSGFTLTRDK
ncbi:MAG: carbohydrate ABC transporter permease [Anaerolineae bacterium]|jgi:sn-glycerol 3-phosphate transport system permease protein|nr:MAG: carbohydrate ABC transporter permease [Anaerolineae bacterium]MCL4876955.1 carbohydrate ABC transporter permease [Anaerolineae bacterium]